MPCLLHWNGFPWSHMQTSIPPQGFPWIPEGKQALSRVCEQRDQAGWWLWGNTRHIPGFSTGTQFRMSMAWGGAAGSKREQWITVTFKPLHHKNPAITGMSLQSCQTCEDCLLELVLLFLGRRKPLTGQKARDQSINSGLKEKTTKHNFASFVQLVTRFWKKWMGKEHELRLFIFLLLHYWSLPLWWHSRSCLWGSGRCPEQPARVSAGSTPGWLDCCAFP